MTILYFPIFSQDICYMLKTDAPPHCELTGLKAYYQGITFDLSQGWAILPEKERALTFSIVFINNIDLEGTTADPHLKIPDNTPFSWYDLTLTFHASSSAHTTTDISPDTHKETYNWTIEKRDPEEVPTRLPYHALVVWIDPDMIDTLKLEPGITDSTLVYLPTIAFKQDIDPDIFEKKLTIALAASLTPDAFHQKENNRCWQCNAKTVLSQPYCARQ